METLDFADTGLIEMLLSNADQDMTGCLLNCSLNGVCRVDSVTLKYRCECNEYFVGASCSIDTRPCSSFPCMNNGKCLQTTETNVTYTCQCDDTRVYTGQRCEIKVNVCLNETCSTNGVCKDIQNEPKCQCFAQYSGDKCQTKSTLLNAIRITKTLSLTTAIAAFASLALIVVFLDAKLCAKAKIKKRERHDIRQFVYVN